MATRLQVFGTNPNMGWKYSKTDKVSTVAGFKKLTFNGMNFQPELVEIRPLANYFDGPNFASATKRPEPVVVTTGVKKRGRPRKNPL